MSANEDKMRIILLVDRDAHPELFKELERVPKNFRAERIRTLSTKVLGVLAQTPQVESLNGTTTDGAKTVEDCAPNEQEAERIRKEAELQNRKKNFKDRLSL